MSTRVEISRVFSVTAAASGITTCIAFIIIHMHLLDIFYGMIIMCGYFISLKIHISLVPHLLSVFLNAIRYVLPIIGISGYRFNPPKCLRILLRSR